MSYEGTVKFIGNSGDEYEFYIYPIGTTFSDEEGGVYIFTRRSQDQQGVLWHQPIYIGKTKSLKDRLLDHNEENCVAENGGTHICVRVVETAVSRGYIELDLLANYDTPCNEQHN